MATVAALHVEHLHKRFGATVALADASLRVARGTIHGLVGENGAGKSTLIKIIAGIHQADSGRISIAEQSFARLTPRQVEALGVQFIHQERLLPASFTVAEALFFGHELRRGPWLDRRRQQREAERLLAEYFALQLPVTALVRELSSAEQQVLQITRALLRKPRVLVFDEPSVALVKQEVTQLLTIVKRLREQGLSILYISHYLQEIHSLCDEVTVLRNGRDVAVVEPRSASGAEIARLMVNREVQDMYPKARVELGAPLLQVRGLSMAGRYRNIDLELRRGEIVGLTGLVGSGAKELVKTLFGLMRADSGSLQLNGRYLQLRSPVQAVAAGLALVPEDRRSQGISPQLSVLENLTLAGLGQFSRWGILSRRQEQAQSLHLMGELAIKASSPQALLSQLSGGNQQKVALGKWLSRRSTVYLLDEPCVGVDVGAKVEIYRLIARLVADGAAVLVLSADLPELLGISDRILVLYRGEIAGEFRPGTCDADQLLACATGAVTASLGGEDAYGSRN
ncbi:sugar ABC transporter ATP-binding protein [Pseudomonas sp. 5P_3.1_Bac2]|uniref:sugar ABC transporter ATP-binding protein n=1 Tax=Pseudomonas sp. 5P_3.1_Bac2 TaxID=2971617 RepID=UPI0021C856D9|nr:sugar ABC transporter ATP-binding protein [Pseudomonas sp. 5P_3.1_Bac2]MCU1718340.1 sugar ABC transporter ATP-binding protein [Pseudomonas sp. 5P_3.1_Bac2]